MAYREEGGKRYENPHTARLDGISKAEKSKESLTKDESDVLSFIYAKSDPLVTMDPDKVRYVKAKPSTKGLDPAVMGDNSITDFNGEFKFLGPMHKCEVL